MLDLEKLTNNILTLSDQSDRYKSDEFRISELVYCPAKAYYYRKLGMRPKLNGKMLSGLLFHEKLPLVFKDLVKGKVEFEVECVKDYRDYKIKGHADVVSDDTVYEFKFSASKLEGKLPLNYYLQSNAYACMLDKENYALVFVNSFTLESRVLSGKKDASAFKIIENSAKKIYECLKNDIVPDGPAYEWECRFCNLKDVCEIIRKRKVMRNEKRGH